MYRLAVVITLLALAFGVDPVATQLPACTHHSDVLDDLNNQYSGTPVAMGLATTADLLKFYRQRLVKAGQSS